jgi:hypothetical protein
LISISIFARKRSFYEISKIVLCGIRRAAAAAVCLLPAFAGVGDCITFEPRSCEELSQKRLKELDLAVESVAELRCVGEGEWSGDLKQFAVYAHPNPRYPNLLAARIDGKLRICSLSLLHGDPDDIMELPAPYGLTDGNSFRKLSISQDRGREDGACAGAHGPSAA